MLTTAESSRRSDPESHSDEGGSSLLVLVLLVGVILLGGAVFISDVSGALANTGTVSDLIQARAQALAGLSDALFRIDQQATPASFCVGPSAQCAVPALPAAPGAQEVARLVAGAQPPSWTVQAEGTVNGRRYAVQETVTRPFGDFAFATFAASSITIHGSGATAQATGPTGSPTCGPAPIGSDGSISCGASIAGTAQVTFPPGSVSGCTNPVTGVGTYAPQVPLAGCTPAPPAASPPTPCMPANSAQTPRVACPVSNTFTGTIEPGVYDCTGSITFSGTTTVDYGSTANGGIVQIYAFPASGQTTLDVSMDAVTANQWQNQSAQLVGNPVALQIYSAGGPGSSVTMGHGTLADALLYAPDSTATVNGGQVTWTGAFVLDSLTINGNPNFLVNYDSRVTTSAADAGGPPAVGSFTTTAPSAFALCSTGNPCP